MALGLFSPKCGMGAAGFEMPRQRVAGVLEGAGLGEVRQGVRGQGLEAGFRERLPAGLQGFPEGNCHPGN
jgi:hypothetical protein